MTDPYAGDRDRARAAIDRAEASIFRRALDLLTQWTSKLHAAVFGSRIGRPNPDGVFETERWFRSALDDEVIVEIRGIFDGAHDGVIEEDDDPAGYRLAREFIRDTRNRLVRIPDSVYGDITRAVFAADKAGDSTDELAERIDEILSASGSERWTHRARTIARTEATAAYNAGTFSGFLGYAAQTGGRWEKAWLAVDDDRTRHTHDVADGQRVPLIVPFSVGGHPGMYPGDPELPAREVVNCRCGMLLVRPGEVINYANRQSREA